MEGLTFPMKTSETYDAVSSSGILGDDFAASGKSYKLVECDEAAGVVAKRALTKKSVTSNTVDYVASVFEPIAGFTPDDLVGTCADGDGLLMQTAGEITLTHNTETIADNADMYWDVTNNRATATFSVSCQFIGKNKGAVTSGTSATVVLDLGRDIRPVKLGGDVVLISWLGAPTDGTSGTGAGYAGPGSLLLDGTNAKLYINTNTKASPTWTVVGTQTT